MGTRTHLAVTAAVVALLRSAAVTLLLLRSRDSVVDAHGCRTQHNNSNKLLCLTCSLTTWSLRLAAVTASRKAAGRGSYNAQQQQQHHNAQPHHQGLLALLQGVCAGCVQELLLYGARSG